MTKETQDVECFTAVDLDSPAKYDLHEPFLPAIEACKLHDAGSSPLESATVIMRLRFLSFVTGSIVSLSQSFLLQLQWDPILKKDRANMLMFFIGWALWTCLVVFFTVSLFVLAVYKYYGTHSTQAVWDVAVFRIETHYLAGLLSIAATSIVTDLLQIEMPTSPLVSILLVLVLVLLTYSVIFRSLVATSPRIEADETKRNTSLRRTYQILAATFLGLIIGFCSQLLWSGLLRRDRITTTVVDNMSSGLTRILATAVVTYAGWLLLRRLVTVEADRLTAERIFRRMEAHYVVCSIVGFFLAWILMDLLVGVHERILPLIIALSVSLLGLHAMIYCFREDTCLEDVELLLKEEELEQVTVQEIVVV